MISWARWEFRLSWKGSHEGKKLSKAPDNYRSGRLEPLKPKVALAKRQMASTGAGVYRLTPRNACCELRIWHGTFCLLFSCCSEPYISEYKDPVLSIYCVWQAGFREHRKRNNPGPEIGCWIRRQCSKLVGHSGAKGCSCILLYVFNVASQASISERCASEKPFGNCQVQAS